MNEEFVEAQQNVIAPIVMDLKSPPVDRRPFISVLVDDMGLSADVFSNKHLRYFYISVAGEYIRSVTSNGTFTLDDVLTALERTYRYNGHQDNAHLLMERWRRKIEEKDEYSGNPFRAAEILKNYAIRETVKAETTDFLARLHGAENPIDEIQDYSAFLSNIGIDRGRALTLRAVIESEGKALAIPETTGYPRLDGKGRDGILAIKGHDTGGYVKGRMIVMVGPPAAGKTSVAVNLAARRAENGMPVVFHSFEMERPTLYRTMICCSALCTPDLAFNPDGASGSQRSAILTTHDLLEKWVRVYDEPTDLAGLARRMKRHQVEYSGMLVLHIIDHIGAFMEASKQSWQQLQTISRDLKSLCELHSGCMLALVHPSGGGETEDELRKHNRAKSLDAYGGKAIRQWADVMFLVGRHNGSDGMGGIDHNLRNATIIQGFKNRQGKGMDDTWYVARFDPVTEHLSQEVILDDHFSVFKPEHTTATQDSF